MQLHITKEQWGEIKTSLALKFNASLVSEYDNTKMPNIGQMVEFLSDQNPILRTCNAGWEVCFNFRIEDGYETCDKSTKKELCDALWEACKHKLNHLPK